MIKCNNAESVDKAISIINNKLGDKCVVNTAKIKNPKMKLGGIENVNNIDNKSLEEDSNTRNFCNYDV